MLIRAFFDASWRNAMVRVAGGESREHWRRDSWSVGCTPSSPILIHACHRRRFAPGRARLKSNSSA
jgi:hypothetical protein